MSKKLRNKPIAWLDLETTGLDLIAHEILDIGIVKDDGTSYSRKVKPKHLESATPKALEVNGYNEEEWKDAANIEDILEEVVDFLEGCVIAGHNVQFDMNFLKRAVLEYLGEGTLRRLPYSWVDTVTLAFEHLVPCGMISLKLDNICTFLGISNVGNHRALVDANRSKQVYEALQRASWFRRLYWRLRVRYLRVTKHAER